jgi:F420-dependent oxidoreductase-like protein
MRIGMMIGEGAGESPNMDEVIRRAQRAEAAGLHSAWLAHAFSHDAISMLDLVGRETGRIELGTAVVPTYPRHPVVMAQQALTTQAASKGRFTLGIGVSHKMVIEGMYGMAYTRHLSHMREYMAVMKPLLEGKPVKYQGEEYRVNMNIAVEGATPVPVVLAALGPKMLDFAGRESAGTLTWMAGHKALSEHVVPRITAAAKDAGRPAPRVIAGMPLAITNNTSKALEVAAKVFAIYRELPAYRAMLDRGGLGEPPEVALIGDPATVSGEIKRLEDIGVTDLCGFVFRADDGAYERTIDFLSSLT